MQPTNHLPVPTLASVSDSYTQWRASGNSKRNTPERLQQLAVALLQHHPKSVVCRSLKISYSALKKWAAGAEFQNPPSSSVAHTGMVLPAEGAAAFVPLPDVAANLAQPVSSSDDQPDTTSLQITLPNGTSLSATIPLQTLITLINQPACSESADDELSV